MGSNEAKEFSISKIMKENQARGCFFKIPPYQRLYEWEKEQIETLLEDVKKAQGEGKKVYFIGNVVVSKEGERYILIDGQQRLTTLFLIGVYLATRSEIKSNPWKDFVKHDKQIRISMPLRENEEKWLLDFINKQNKSNDDFKDLSKKNPNIHRKITEGLEVIAEWFEKNTPKEESDDKLKLASFAEYLYGNNKAGVRFALVELAKDTDLNQFFVRMNNRGKQLEKHEILKARLLGILQKGEWQKYAKIWDLCSDMDKYIFALEEDRKTFRRENIKSLQDERGKSLFNIIKKFNGCKIAKIDVEEESDSKTKLFHIIKNSKSQQIKEESRDAIYRSIIDFPTFLLHVFKLFALKKNQNFDVSIKKDDLLKTMWDDRVKFWNKDNVREFIQQLLLYRFAFDYFVIKQKASDSSYVIDWNYIKDNRSGRILFEGNTLTNDSLKDLVMIQNYLRVARAGEKQNYHHWLTYMLSITYKTLFFKEIKKIETTDIKNFVERLQKLDTDLAIRQITNDGESELLGIANNWLKSKKSSSSISEKKFNQWASDNLNQGVGTPHYWFYRLEYYLWKSNKINGQSFDKKKFGKIKQNFRFRGLNSVEHIQPQSKAEGNWQDKQDAETRRIDCFGNLALVSQSFNSSLSNQDTGDKILDLRKKINKDDVESLKLWLAYAKMKSQKDNKKEWTYETAKDHQDEMLEVLAKSLK